MKIRRRAGPLLLAAPLFLLGPWLRPATAQLGPEFQINAYTTGYQIAPAVSADDSGNFVVAWTSFLQDGSSWGVLGQRFDLVGSPVGSEFQVNTYTTNSQEMSAVAADGSGNFVVTWASDGQDGSSWGVFGQRFNLSGNPVGSEFMINTYTTNSQDVSAVAADGVGNFVVVWESGGQDGSNWGVFGQRFNSAGSPVGSEFQVNSYTTERQYLPAVATDGSGNFVVVWESFYQDGSSSGIFGQRFNSTGAALGSEFQVNTYTTDSQREPAVAVDGLGNFLVVWDGAGLTDSQGVFGQRFNSAGSKVGSEFLINTNTTLVQLVPTVAAYGSGNFVVAWDSYGQDGSVGGVFGQRFSLLGNPVGSEFQVNTFTAYNQSNPAMATDSAGRFVVVWHSALQDGDLGGVFGRRMDTTVFGHGFEANPPFWSATTAAMCSGFCLPSGTPDGVCFCDTPCLTFGDCCLDACTTCGECVP